MFSGFAKIRPLQLIRKTQVPPLFTGTLLLANLASEFISQRSHTGIMDTTFVSMRKGCRFPPPLLLVGRDVIVEPHSVLRASFDFATRRDTFASVGQDAKGIHAR